MQLEDELETSQKTLEYYQNDVLPTIKENTTHLETKIKEVNNENLKLVADNTGLRGSLDDKIKYYEN